MNISAPEETNWYVITGGPSTGKSKIIDHLSFRGYQIRPEAARIHIDQELSKGRDLRGDIRKDEAKFQEEVLQMKVRAEEAADPKTLLFWERGMPDSIVYMEHCGGDSTSSVQASARFRYKKIFLLDPLEKYEEDYARTEDAAAARNIHEALGACYSGMGYDVIRVPVASISERVDFILKEVGECRF